MEASLCSCDSTAKCDCALERAESASQVAAGREEHRRAVVNAVTFVLALLFHTMLEGFAFGVQVSF